MEWFLTLEAFKIWGPLLFGGSGILVAIGGGIKWFIPWLFTTIKQYSNKPTDFRKVFMGYGAIYDALNNLVIETSASRAILVRVHNGGSTPKIGSPLNVSIVAEVRTSELPSIRERFQNRPVDEAYIRMLIDLQNKKHFLINTSDLSEGILKDSYEDEGVEAVKISEVCSDKDNYFILATHYKHTPENDAKLRSKNSDCVNTIHQVLAFGPAPIA